jgi:hypothetical protein
VAGHDRDDHRLVNKRKKHPIRVLTGDVSTIFAQRHTNIYSSAELQRGVLLCPIGDTSEYVVVDWCAVDFRTNHRRLGCQPGPLWRRLLARGITLWVTVFTNSCWHRLFALSEQSSLSDGSELSLPSPMARRGSLHEYVQYSVSSHFFHQLGSNKRVLGTLQGWSSRQQRQNESVGRR